MKSRKFWVEDPPEGPVYTKHQCQRCDNSAMTLHWLGFATHFQASPLISRRTESLASSQSGRSIDADPWCKPALRSSPKASFTLASKYTISHKRKHWVLVMKNSLSFCFRLSLSFPYYLPAELWIIILEVWWFIIQQVNNNATSPHHQIKNQPFSHKKSAKLRIGSICTWKCCRI